MRELIKAINNLTKIIKLLPSAQKTTLAQLMLLKPEVSKHLVQTALNKEQGEFAEFALALRNLLSTLDLETNQD